MSVIDRIAILAEEKGISQAFICKQLGVQRNWVSTARRQQSNVSDERIATIAAILGTTVAYLKGETDDPSPQKEKSPSDVDELLSKPDINELLELYRALTPGEQRKALSVLKALKETE